MCVDMLSTRYMTAMDSSQQQQKMTSPQASGSRRVGSEKRDVIRSRSENRQRPHQHTDDAQDNPRWFRVVNRNEKWLGRFFVFSPTCRSVSVGFENETEEKRNRNRTLLGQFLGETSQKVNTSKDSVCMCWYHM